MVSGVRLASPGATQRFGKRARPSCASAGAKAPVSMISLPPRKEASRTLLPRAWVGLLAGVLASALAACASPPRIPYTEAEAERAEVAGIEGVRTWADTPDPTF